MAIAFVYLSFQIQLIGMTVRQSIDVIIGIASYMILLPNALYKSILRIFYSCKVILQLLAKRATEKLLTDR